MHRAFQELVKARAEVAVSSMGEATAVLEGTIPAETLHDYERRMPRLSRGEGVLTLEFGGYRALPAGVVPTCERRDADPHDRKAYLQALRR